MPEIPPEPEPMLVGPTVARANGSPVLIAHPVEPTAEEVCRRSGLSLEDTRVILKMSRQPLSLDQPIGDHEDSVFGEFLEDHRDDDPLLETNREALKAQIDTAMETLNYREREILLHVADGMSNKEVARALDLQEKTVKHYMTNILKKLQVRNRVEAAILARESMRT